MGTYLSTPVLDKGEESGQSTKCPISPLAWGVVDMQGWRKSMEDAHVACADVPVPLHLDKEDGCQTQHDAKVFGVFDGHGGPEVARFCQLYLVDVLTGMATWKQDSPTEKDAVGQALVAAFHALDRMIDDPERRDEIIRLRTEKPNPGERRTAILDLPENFYEEPRPPIHGATDCNTDKNNEVTPVFQEENNVQSDPPPQEEETAKNTPTDEKQTDTEPANKHAATTESADSTADSEEKGNTPDDDSLKAVGHDTKDQLDDELMEEEGVPRAVSVVSQERAFLEQVLNIGGGDQLSISRNSSGQVEIQVTDEEDQEENDATAQGTTMTSNGPSASMPTLIHNGRQVCNLPEHPIHAGCTAVVAVLIGRTLTIANAGDSRAVLCREGGRADPLSFDHKPLQEREMQRITKAGGFVNQFGRVNGNLNLSRSLGDLKYKQVPGLPPAEQMITAEPDIVQVTLHPKDEFFVLGCDGIWDCLTNEQAIQYVRERIDSKTPTEIGIEMLDDIISEDPRATQGIGGDNMTIMIVDLQPETRAYR